jgi:hypothetical protein
MNVQQAVDQPRLHHQWQPDTLYLERGISPDTRRVAGRGGHEGARRAGNVGSVEAILVGPDARTAVWLEGALNGAERRQGGRLLRSTMQSSAVDASDCGAPVEHGVAGADSSGGIPAGGDILCAQHLDYRNKAQVEELATGSRIRS